MIWRLIYNFVFVLMIMVLFQVHLHILHNTFSFIRLPKLIIMRKSKTFSKALLDEKIITTQKYDLNLDELDGQPKLKAIFTIWIWVGFGHTWIGFEFAQFYRVRSFNTLYCKIFQLLKWRSFLIFNHVKLNKITRECESFNQKKRKNNIIIHCSNET